MLDIVGHWEVSACVFVLPTSVIFSSHSFSSLLIFTWRCFKGRGSLYLEALLVFPNWKVKCGDCSITTARAKDRGEERDRHRERNYFLVINSVCELSLIIYNLKLEGEVKKNTVHSSSTGSSPSSFCVSPLLLSCSLWVRKTADKPQPALPDSINTKTLSRTNTHTQEHMGTWSSVRVLNDPLTFVCELCHLSCLYSWWETQVPQTYSLSLTHSI